MKRIYYKLMVCRLSFSQIKLDWFPTETFQLDIVTHMTWKKLESVCVFATKFVEQLNAVLFKGIHHIFN